MTNPFTIAFGQEPEILIDRSIELNIIPKTFNSDKPTTRTFLLTGVRGSGKTVSLTKLYEQFKKDNNWYVIDLNPASDLLEGLAAKLYDIPSLKNIFIKAQLNLSGFGIGVSLQDVPPISHIETAIEQMLTQIQKKNKKVLICIDEASNNNYMKVFTSAFQLFTRHKLPIFLLMTGLYQNIDALQNEDTLTFLYRAPKISLNNLSISAISLTYQNVFHIDKEEALKLAKLTNGYPFAYQVLGYLCFENNTVDLDKVLPSFERYLDDYVYRKIWSELSSKEKEIVISIANNNTKIKDIRENVNIESNAFSVYRDRLAKKGIVDTSTYGSMYFTLPRFGEIIQTYIY